MRGSTRSPSPAPPRWGAPSHARSEAPAKLPPWNSGARPRTSSSTTPRSTKPSRGSSTGSSSTRARSAARSEERRVGKEGRAGGAREHEKKKNEREDAEQRRKCDEGAR